MKAVVFCFAIIATTLSVFVSAQSQADRDAVILKYDSDNIGVDGYNFAFETSNGISQEERGQLQNAGTEDEKIAVRGQFSFVGKDQVTYTVTYIADENGFQPSGAHIS